jgi:hypothetical protein
MFILQIPTISNIANHDTGAAAAIEYWVLNNFIFGKDIIQNIGPLGFFNNPTIFTGFLDEIKFFFNILFTLLVSYFICDLTRGKNIYLRIFTLICSCFLVNGDTLFYLLISLISFHLFLQGEKKINFIYLFVLGLLSLTKGTFFVLSIFIIIILFCSFIFMRQNILAIKYLATFVFSILLCWIIVNQDIAYFPAFVKNIFIFSAGYNEAMATFESKEMFFLGFSSLLILGICLINFIFQNKNHNMMISSFLIIQGGILFIVWKHGFVRADEHVVIFFQYIIINYLILLLSLNDIFKINFKKFYTISYILVFFFSFLGITVTLRSLPTDKLITNFINFDKKLFTIINYNDFFIKNKIKLSKEKNKLILDETALLIKNKRVGYFGGRQGIAIYNNFNYVNSPAIISFGTPNEELINEDYKFFKDDNIAPEFLIYDLKTIDNRMASSDSSYAQLQILHRYELLNIERQHLILKRKKNQKNLLKKYIKTYKVELNKKINIPDKTLKPMWVSINISKNNIQKLVSFLYKPPQYFIEVEYKNDTKEKFRLIPNMAKSGFMINPSLNNNYEVFKYRISQKTIKNSLYSSLYNIKSLKIGCDHLDFFCDKNVKIDLYHLTNLSQKADNNVIFKTYKNNYTLKPKFSDNILSKSLNINSQEIIKNENLIYKKPIAFDYVKGKIRLIPFNRIGKSSQKNIVRLLNWAKTFFRPAKINLDSTNKFKVNVFFQVYDKKGILKFEDIIQFDNDNLAKEIDLSLPKSEGFLIIKFNDKSKFSQTKLRLSDFILYQKQKM